MNAMMTNFFQTKTRRGVSYTKDRHCSYLISTVTVMMTLMMITIINQPFNNNAQTWIVSALILPNGALSKSKLSLADSHIPSSPISPISPSITNSPTRRRSGLSRSISKLNYLNPNKQHHHHHHHTASRDFVESKHSTTQMMSIFHKAQFKNRLITILSQTRGGSQLNSSITNSSSSSFNHDDDDDDDDHNNNENNGSIATKKNENSSPHSNSNNKNNHIRPSSKKVSRKVTISILSILTATTLNLLGFTMTSPLTPTLGKHFSLPTGASFGSLTSAYPLGMLFGLFTWPRLSDYMGRKKIMFISLLGSSIGLGLQSYCIFNVKSLELFLMSRIVTGVFSGCAPVAKAYLADVGDRSGKLAMYLAWRDAASTLAYILGPVCGGILFEVLRQSRTAAASTTASTLLLDGQSHALGSVIGVSAFGSLLAAILIWSFVDEKIGSGGDGKDNAIETQDDYEIVACPLGMKLWTGVATVCIVSFLYHVADSTFFAFFPALLQNQLQMDPRQIGLVFTMLSCITFCFSATSLSSKLISSIGVVNTCALGLGAVGAGLGALSAAAAIPSTGMSLNGVGYLPFLIIGAAGLYFCGVPLYGPTIPTMLLQCVPPYQRGAGKLCITNSVLLICIFLCIYSSLCSYGFRWYDQHSGKNRITYRNGRHIQKTRRKYGIWFSKCCCV